MCGIGYCLILWVAPVISLSANICVVGKNLLFSHIFHGNSAAWSEVKRLCWQVSISQDEFGKFDKSLSVVGNIKYLMMGFSSSTKNKGKFGETWFKSYFGSSRDIRIELAASAFKYFLCFMKWLNSVPSNLFIDSLSIKL